jgi:threonine dehydratase
LAAGRLVGLPVITSIARTLGAPKVCEFALDHVRGLVPEGAVVDDTATVAALVLILELAKYLVEPAAAWLPPSGTASASGRAIRSVVLLCGGNVSLDDVCAFRQQFREGPAGAPPADRP